MAIGTRGQEENTYKGMTMGKSDQNNRDPIVEIFDSSRSHGRLWGPLLERILSKSLEIQEKLPVRKNS